VRGKEEKEGKEKLEVRIQTREMLLTGVSALGQCEGRQQKQRRDGRNAATTTISKVVRKNSSSFSVRCETCDRSKRNGRLMMMMMIKKKKRKKEVESDKLTIRASSSSSFEPVIIDIGDGTNDNNNGSKGGGGGGGGSWFGGSYKNSDDDGDDESNRFNKLFKFLLFALLFRQTVTFVLGKFHEPSYVEQKQTRREEKKTSDCAIIIPALNEEENIELLLLQIRALRPQPTEVVVAVGDSTDDTAKVAEKYGAKVVRGKRGRSRQMNAGVHALATHPTNVLFLHADTMPFPDILNVIDETMRDAKAIVGGFVSLITTEKKTYWAMSYHNVFKSDFYTAILYPKRYALGLKLLFGDQGIFCRLDDFTAVDGYDETLPIMEDADLCVRMQRYGSSQKKNTASGVRLVDRVITTSGRRIESMGGNLKSTLVHFLIGGAWGVFKVKGDGLVWLYQKFYGWNERGEKSKQKNQRKD
jgi:glycosyltransferase involved in cell wall biosynthesis